MIGFSSECFFIYGRGSIDDDRGAPVSLLEERQRADDSLSPVTVSQTPRVRGSCQRSQNDQLLAIIFMFRSNKSMRSSLLCKFASETGARMGFAHIYLFIGSRNSQFTHNNSWPISQGGERGTRVVGLAKGGKYESTCGWTISNIFGATCMCFKLIVILT